MALLSLKITVAPLLAILPLPTRPPVTLTFLPELPVTVVPEASETPAFVALALVAVPFKLTSPPTAVMVTVPDCVEIPADVPVTPVPVNETAPAVEAIEEPVCIKIPELAPVPLNVTLEPEID